MNGTPTAKFTFDTEFRAEGDLVSNAARARRRRVFTQEELDQMFTRAHHEGQKAGQVRAAEAMTHSVDELVRALRAALDSTHAEVELLRRDAALLALAAARKLAPIALAALPAGDVEEALKEAMHQAIGEPRIVLRASQEVIEALSGKLAEIAREMGYEGRVVASADPALSGGDCRIEWRGGGAERSMAALETAVGEVIARRFSQTSVPVKG